MIPLFPTAHVALSPKELQKKNLFQKVPPNGDNGYHRRGEDRSATDSPASKQEKIKQVRRARRARSFNDRFLSRAVAGSPLVWRIEALLTKILTDLTA